ncbi:MAG: FAD-binding protein [Endozoicomonas sp.]
MPDNINAWDEEYDVVVVGSGAGGLTAAICAHDLGLKALVVEKSDLYGGTSAISGGGIWIPDNYQIPGLGAEDSEEKALGYIRRVIGAVPDDGRLETYVANGKKMVKYLEDNTQVKFLAQPAYTDYYPEVEGGMPGYRSMDPAPYHAGKLGEEFNRLRPPTSATLMMGRMSMSMKDARVMLTRSPGYIKALMKTMWRYWSDLPWRFKSSRDRYLTLGSALLAALRASMVDRNMALWLNAPMKKLIDDDGNVVGLEVEKDGRSVKVKAKNGVIIAAGGFEHSQEMREKYHPQPSRKEWSATPAGNNTGDGIQAGLSLGAEVASMDLAWWSPTSQAPGSPQATVMFIERALPGSIMVNSAGRRFVNEAGPYDAIGYAMYEADKEEGATAVPCWFIFDTTYRKNYPCGPMLPGYASPDKALPKSLKDNYFFRENSIAELAERIGVDRNGLVNTVEQYNQHAREGEDPEFHKGESLFDRYYGDDNVKPNPCVGPVEKGPFYAVKVNVGDIGTKGGLYTDVNARVLRKDGQPIEGLYSIGNSMASPMMQVYPGAGSTIGPAMTFGYLAANFMKDHPVQTSVQASVLESSKEMNDAVEA